jgi:hypothetical protein
MINSDLCLIGCQFYVLCTDSYAVWILGVDIIWVHIIMMQSETWKNLILTHWRTMTAERRLPLITLTTVQRNRKQIEIVYLYNRCGHMLATFVKFSDAFS